MIKYAKVLNEETGLCEIGVGTNTDFYISIGMTQQDVEQSDVDNCWYLTEKCPHKPDAQKLQEAKEAKYQEALQGAKDYLENDAAFQFDELNSIETSSENIGKMTAYALDFLTGTTEPKNWTSKEDNVLSLSAEDVSTILRGIETIQTEVWTVKFVAYKNAIGQASTVEEVEAITINYEEGE